MLAAMQDPEARAAMEQPATEKHDIVDDITAREKAARTAREVELNPLHRLKLESEEKRLELHARDMENRARKDDDQHSLMLALLARFVDK
mmetsp:Transcript_27899/g.78872  ORF Transcript_27899/g.78872 Transcript_27899/m.78872 type:complete len:90 (+) Transcript_27899:1395-1664(+)